MDNLNSGYKENPLVSIIVPIYNVENYITQCLDSLINQTLKQIEIILVDDGSPDNCPAICDAIAKQDNRIRVIHQENGGYGKACNAGLLAARGEYIGIVEPDDYTELNMFERLYCTAKSNNLDVVRCHYFFFNCHKNTNKRVDLSDIPQNIVFSPRDVYSVFTYMPAIWAALYKHDFVTENNIAFLETPGASYQDTSFAFKVYACASRFMLVEDTLIHYRIDNENSSIHSKEKIFCVCDEYTEIERFVNTKGLFDTIGYIIPKIKFGTYMWNYHRLVKKNRWDFMKQFSQEMRRHIAQKEIRKGIFLKKDIFRIYAIAFLYPLYHFMQCVK